MFADLKPVFLKTKMEYDSKNLFMKLRIIYHTIRTPISLLFDISGAPGSLIYTIETDVENPRGLRSESGKLAKIYWYKCKEYTKRMALEYRIFQS
jgi:hypothetical protein